MAKTPWTMPEWMHRYKDYLTWQGSEEKWIEYVERIYNDDGKNSNVFNNAPLALICVHLKGQVDLLLRLHRDGLLKD